MSDDLISRQAALDDLNQLSQDNFTVGDWVHTYNAALIDADGKIRELPSVDFTKKIPYYRAKHINSDRYEDGFYFAMPETTYCFIKDYEQHPMKIHHFIINHRMSDWGLPNRTEGTEIDPNTLKFIGWFTVRESYGTESWVERDNNG